jgi:dTDP-4-amino-4,6-dideoxygalactose transaminase
MNQRGLLSIHARREGQARLLQVTPSSVQFAALERQNGPLLPEFQRAFERVVARSSFVLGKEVERFEDEFAEYCGVSHCVGVASGTAALALLLIASGIGPGDEVILPAHTFIATALAVARTGATPVVCDVHPGTGLIDPNAARALVGPRTAAVIAVHLYGQVCDMAALEELTGQRGLLLLEDAAQAHGASDDGRRAGSFGVGAAFSFYPSKNLGALGDGGAVCTGDEQIAARIRQLRNLGQRGKGEHVELAYNERLDGLQAALLRVKLPHLDDWNAARRRHAERYRELLPAAVTRIEERANGVCVYHLFPVRVGERDRVAAAMDAQGVQTGIHYDRPVHRHRAWATYPLQRGEVTHANAWAAEELSLPMHPDLQPDELERVVDALESAIATSEDDGDV